MNYPNVLARYANDAKGLGRGLLNNCKYVEDKGRVFIVAIKDIPAGAELLISYGKEYWDTLKKFMHPASLSYFFYSLSES